METLLYELIEVMARNNKEFKDIKYITCFRPEAWDEDSPEEAEFNIEMKEFIEIAKTIDSTYSTLNMRFVGEDFFITSDPDECGYFDYIEIPQKKPYTFNLAKELLLYPNEKAGVLMGIEDPAQDE